jgi:hypothetical protein
MTSTIRSFTWKTAGREFRAYTELDDGRTMWRYVVSSYPSREFSLRELKATDQSDRIRIEIQANLPSQELAMVKEAADTQFLERGMEYYVVARSAARAHLGLVCGNLYHHAIEMCLKARLVRSVVSSLDELKSFRHNLNKTWRAFKQECPAAPLAQYDNAVATLNKFEKLRYPDAAVLKRGTQVMVQWLPSSVPTGDVSKKAPPRYVLIVTEIDRLLAAVFAASSRNPLFLPAD